MLIYINVLHQSQAIKKLRWKRISHMEAYHEATIRTARYFVGSR